MTDWPSRVYIAGPMTGVPDLNRPAFTRAAAELEAAGMVPVNPHGLKPAEHPGRPCPNSYAINVEDGHGASCYLGPALALMLTCDEVLFLPGWHRSVGASAEFAVAHLMGMPMRFCPEEIR